MTSSITVPCVLTRKVTLLARKMTSGTNIDFRRAENAKRRAFCLKTRQNELFSYFSWLLSKHPMFVRTSQDVYLEKATQFIGKVVEQVKDLQFYTAAGEKGGPIIMTQVILWFSSFYCDILCKIFRQLLISKVHVGTYYLHT